jgi:hypothetical protein
MGKLQPKKEDKQALKPGSTDHIFQSPVNTSCPCHNRKGPDLSWWWWAQPAFVLNQRLGERPACGGEWQLCNRDWRLSIFFTAHHQTCRYLATPSIKCGAHRRDLHPLFDFGAETIDFVSLHVFMSL